MLRHIEVIVDKWPIGSDNTMRTKGDRVLLDAEAARILVGMGKVAYVDEEAAPTQAKGRRYNRRDMKARD